MLAVSVAWDTALHRSYEAAVKVASKTLTQVTTTGMWFTLSLASSASFLFQFLYRWHSVGGLLD